MADEKTLMAIATDDKEYDEAGSKFVQSPIALVAENIDKRFSLAIKGIGIG